MSYFGSQAVQEEILMDVRGIQAQRGITDVELVIALLVVTSAVADPLGEIDAELRQGKKG